MLKKILAILLIITGLFAGFVVLPAAIGSIGDVSNRLKAGDEKTVTDEVKTIAELSVLEYQYSNAVKLTDQKTLKQLNDLKLPFTTKEIVIKYDGVIKLGVDFNEIEVDVHKDVSGKVKSIDVTLPPVEIMSNEIDRDSMDFPLEKNNLFNQIKTSDYNKIEKKAKKEMAKVVRDQGVTDRAKAEAEAKIKGLLCGLYGSELELNFKESAK